VPLVGRYWSVDILDRMTAAPSGVVHGNVSFQRVGPCDVIVVTVLEAPDDATCAILFAFHWFELDFYEPLGEGDILSYAPRKCPLARLLEHVRLAWCRAVGFDRPLGQASACHAAGPACGHCACGVLIEPCNVCRRGSRDQGSGKQDNELLHP